MAKTLFFLPPLVHSIQESPRTLNISFRLTSPAQRYGGTNHALSPYSTSPSHGRMCRPHRRTSLRYPDHKMDEWFGILCRLSGPRVKNRSSIVNNSFRPSVYLSLDLPTMPQELRSLLHLPSNVCMTRHSHGYSPPTSALRSSRGRRYGLVEVVRLAFEIGLFPPLMSSA